MVRPGQALKSGLYAGFRFPIWACDFKALFGGGIPTESRSFSSEKYIDTGTPEGRLFFHITAAFE